MSRSAKPRLLPWLAVAIALVVLLPSVYMGAYYAMLKGPTFRFAEKPLSSGAYLLTGLAPIYRIDSEAISYTFSPAHQIDRKIRPDYWGEQ